MYKKRQEQKITHPTGGSLERAIHGSGLLEVGAYEAIVVDVEPTADDQGDRLMIEWRDRLTDDKHRESMFTLNTIKGVGFTSEWRNFRASMLPDIECQRILDNLTVTDTAKSIVGLMAEITIEKSEGWELIYESGQYCAINKNKVQLCNWENTRQEVVKVMEGRPRARNRVETMIAAPSNIERFKKNVKQLHPIEESTGEVSATSSLDNLPAYDYGTDQADIIIIK